MVRYFVSAADFVGPADFENKLVKGGVSLPQMCGSYGLNEIANKRSTD